VVDLSTSYLGLSLSSSVVVSASPLSEDLARIQEMASTGAAAVVLLSLFEEQLTSEPEGSAPGSSGSQEGGSGRARHRPAWRATTAGRRATWSISGRPRPLPPSPPLPASTRPPGSWVRYAREVAAAGADALELNICHVPTSPELTGATLEQMSCDLVGLIKSNVRGAVGVPLFQGGAGVDLGSRRLPS
jgi:dihydroorotate dehydrogenase (fumarate)